MVDITITGMIKNIDEVGLIPKFMKLRKEIFMESEGWDLIENDGLEFDQYDRLDAVYVIACDDGEVIGGIRLARTLSQYSTYNDKVKTSYMIRDAFLGLLEPGIPKRLCDKEPPTGHDIWEASRIVTKNPNISLLMEMLKKGTEYMVAEKATECMFIGPPTFKKLGKVLGYDPVPLGPVIGEARDKFQAFWCEFPENITATVSVNSEV